MSEGLSLKELSERASQGDWSLGDEKCGYRYLNASGNPSKPGLDQNVKWSGFARFVVEMEDGMSCAGPANVELVIALVSAYRAGRLHTSEDLASAEAAAHAKGRAEGIGEAVKVCEEEVLLCQRNFGFGSTRGSQSNILAAAIRALLPTTGGSDADAKR